MAKKASESEKLLLTLKEASELLGISTSTIERLIEDGAFVAPVKIGSGSKIRRWRKSDLETWVNSLDQKI